MLADELVGYHVRSMMNCEERIRREWASVLAHESGHALMALLKGQPCQGIFVEESGWMFCAIYGGYPPGRTQDDYVISAAGVAAELLMFPSRQSEGAGQDREFFDFTGAPRFDDIVIEARELLVTMRATLEAFIDGLVKVIVSVDCDLDRLEEVAMTGDPHTYLTLLRGDALQAIRSSFDAK